MHISTVQFHSLLDVPRSEPLLINTSSLPIRRLPFSALSLKNACDFSIRTESHPAIQYPTLSRHPWTLDSPLRPLFSAFRLRFSHRGYPTPSPSLPTEPSPGH